MNETTRMSERWGVSDEDDAVKVDRWELYVDIWLELYSDLTTEGFDGRPLTDEQVGVYTRPCWLADVAERIEPYMTRQANKEARARATQLMNACIRAGFEVDWMGTATFEAHLTSRSIRPFEVECALMNDEDLPAYKLYPLSSGGVRVEAR